VSTLHQKENGYSLDWQIENMPNKARESGFQDIDLYVEAESGTRINRPEFKKMMALVESGYYQAIFVAEKSRLSRIDDPMEAGEIIRKVLLYNCKVCTVNTVYDPSHPEGRFHWMIDDAVNVYEIQRTKQRFRNGKIEKLQQGGYVGGNPPTGYRYAGRDPDTGKMRFEIDPPAAKMVQKAFEYALQNVSLKGIEKRLYLEGHRNINGNKIYAATISRWLKNPHYAGYTESKAKGVLVERNDFLEPIIKKETFHTVQGLLSRRSVVRDKRTTHPLSGILTCGNCGSGMKVDQYHGYRVYVCQSKWKGNPCKGDSPKSIKYDIAHQLVVDFLPVFIETLQDKKFIDREVKRQAALNKSDNEAGKLQEQHKALHKKIMTLAKQQEDRFSEARESLLAEREAELKQIESRLKELEKQPLKLPSLPDLKEAVSLLVPEDTEDLSFLVSNLFDKIYVMKRGHYRSGLFEITRVVTTTGTCLKTLKNGTLYPDTQKPGF
jgi:site-specific DNA recombinase